MESAEGAEKRIQEQYREIAAGEAGHGAHPDPVAYAGTIGYSPEDIASVPKEAVLCLGCGNPLVIAQLKEGETVLDLGCGGGLDAFLAAQKVGHGGRVVGVDATPEMVDKATDNAKKGDYKNVEFRRAAIERLPLADNEVDVAISNCVLNHCADKLAAFKEVHRVLKPGGRLCVADLVTAGEFPEEALKDEVWGNWIARASGKAEYLAAIADAGFRDVVLLNDGAFTMSEEDDRLRGRIINIQVKAVKQ